MRRGFLAITATALIAAGAVVGVAGLPHRHVVHVPNRHTHTALYYPSAQPTRST